MKPRSGKCCPATSAVAPAKPPSSPPSWRFPLLDLGRTFLQSAERAPQAIALVDGATRLSYAEWAQRIGAAQRGLKALGLGRGDHLLSILQNRAEAATLHWACQFAGIVMTPLNWRAKPEEIDHVLA